MGAGSAQAAPCPGGGPATCGPDPGAPTLTFTPPPAQTNAPGGQQGQQGGQDQQGIATSPAQGGDNGPGIQAQTPQFGTPGQQAPNIPGNEQPGQGGQQQPAQGQQTGQRGPVQTTAPGGPQQTGQQQPGQQTQSGQPTSPTITVTKTESQCAVPGAGNGAGTPGNPGSGDSSNNSGGTGPDNGDSENQDGAPSWAYLVGEVSALMTGRRGRKAGPLNNDGSAPTNTMIPGDQVDGENYKLWTTPDGNRTYILSENQDAPSQYRFALNQPPGGSSKVNDDGSASVFDRDGNQVNRFDTPWAFDVTNAERIPTRYALDGNDLVQTIDRPEGNNNPILADPFEAPTQTVYAASQSQSTQIDPTPPSRHEPAAPTETTPSFSPQSPAGNTPAHGPSDSEAPASGSGSNPGQSSRGEDSQDSSPVGNGGAGRGAGHGDSLPPNEPDEPGMKEVVLPFIVAAAIIEMILAILLVYIALVGIFYAATHREETYDFIARQLPNWVGDQRDRIRETVDGWFRENPAPSAPPKEGDKDKDKPNEGTPPSPATIPPVPPAYIPPGGGSPGQTPPTPATPTPAAPGVSPQPPEIKPTTPTPTPPNTPQPDAPVIVPPPPGQPGTIPAPSTPKHPNTPTPGNTPRQPAPNTPLPGGPRPSIVPIPTEPPDPGKPPTPGRIDPDTGLPVIPQQPRPSTTPQPGIGSAPSASNGGGQAPKPKKQPPAPTKPPPKPGTGGGPGRWEWTNESGGANVKQNRPFQEAVTGVDGAWSYVVNGVKFDGFEIIKGLVKALVDAKYGSSGYGALLKPDGTLVDVYSPSTPPFIKGIYDSLISEVQRQVAAVNALPNPQEFPIYWVANSPATAAALKAVIEQVPEAAGRITVITADVWNALKGIG